VKAEGIIIRLLQTGEKSLKREQSTSGKQQHQHAAMAKWKCTLLLLNQ